ncbi:hypothetical protein RJ639_023738 [Escallonia herrerae]|uniref:Nodulin-like domain-containing protein n=1 Tax=Escallonia herrerae TaxID=1293975 RepID=A0AA88UZY8_9ASTE|nr:hypothetical protein RJ639_023738 [Escallonia herrerae]
MEKISLNPVIKKRDAIVKSAWAFCLEICPRALYSQNSAQTVYLKTLSRSSLSSYSLHWGILKLGDKLDFYHNLTMRIDRESHQMDRNENGAGKRNGEQQIDSDGGEHLDPVQLRRVVRLRHLLLRPQVEPGLRPVDARHRLRLQGHRRQRRRPLRPPLLRRHDQARLLRAVAGAPGRGGSVLCRLPAHLARGAIHRPPVPVMWAFMLTFFNTANFVTGVHNFPDYGGTIVGIMKGFLGLSGAVLIQVYQTLFKGSPSTFLLMLALLLMLLTLLLMCLVRIHPTITVDEKKHLNGFSVIALAAAAYLLILIILENIVTFPLWARLFTFAVLLLLLSSPLKIAISAQREDSQRLSATTSVVRTPLIDHSEPAELTVKEELTASNMPHVGEEMNLLQATKSPQYTTVEINTLVSLWSIWNFLGRFGGGYISDIFLHTRGWARPVFMTLMLAIMTAGHVIIASGFPGNLYTGSVIVGVCYGSLWSLMPTISSEIFGVRHMGTIFNTIAIASPIGSYVLSVRVIGCIYDKEASGEGNSCTGTQCFMLSFFIFASVTLFGFLISLILVFRTWRFYELVLLRRLHHSATQ